MYHLFNHLLKSFAVKGFVNSLDEKGIAGDQLPELVSGGFYRIDRAWHYRLTVLKVENKVFDFFADKQKL